MVNLRVYAFCYGGYFGFGLSPAAALFEAREAGCPAKTIKDGKITALPVGITKYWVSDMGGMYWVSDMGGINWEFPPDSKTERELYFAGDLTTYVRQGNKWLLKIGAKESDADSLCLGYDGIWRWPDLSRKAA